MTQPKEIHRKSFFISDILDSSAVGGTSLNSKCKTSAQGVDDSSCDLTRSEPSSSPFSTDNPGPSSQNGSPPRTDTICSDSTKNNGINPESQVRKSDKIINRTLELNKAYSGPTQPVPSFPGVAKVGRFGFPFGGGHFHPPGVFTPGVGYHVPGVGTKPLPVSPSRPSLGGYGYAERLSQLVASQNSCFGGQLAAGCCPTGPSNYSSSFYFPYGGFIPGTDTTSLRSEMISVPIPLPVYVRSRPSPDMDGSLRAKKCRRSRTVFTELQLMGLEKRFEGQKYLSTPDRVQLAKSLGLSQIQVKTWYQNRRMKWKKQVLQCGGTEPPTKPKGRPKKNSIPSSEALDEVTSSESAVTVTRNTSDKQMTDSTDCPSSHDMDSDDDSSDDISVIDIADGEVGAS